MTETRPLRSYGRRKGKPLSARKERLIEELLPRLRLDFGKPAPGRLQDLFPVPVKEVWLEIGFGSGEHLLWQAKRHTEVGFIGCEPFVNGVATALGHVRDRHLANVRIHGNDALDVLRRLPDGALSFVYLLHPDPWPKARHAKRRMINDGPLDLIAAKLKPGGELRVATDHPVYLEWTLVVMQRHRDDFEWLAEKPSDFLEPPGGWIETRYGAKSRREGRRPFYLRYRRA